jgi:transposase
MSKSSRQQRGNARTQAPERFQVEMRFLALDQWLDPEHRVRVVWQYVEALDLSPLYQSIKATEDHVGRTPIDPRILFALWLFATLEGVTSARRVAELSTRDIPYLWICGGVSVNHHTLSDFRTEHGEFLEQVLTDSIAVLLHQGLVALETVAQDGMRVRASAGSGSFRRAASLEEAQQRAQAHVDALRQQQEQDEQDGDGGDRRRRAAQERAAREKLERIAAAQEALKEMQTRYDQRSGTPRSQPRASTTDPDARRMKMGDNGTRPALNVQFASDGEAQLVVSVEVTSQGSDSGLLRPMYDDVIERYGVVPEAYLVDGGFGKKEDITHVESQGTAVYAPLYAEEQQLAAGKDPYAARANESPQMAAHRARMGTEAGKTKYKERAGIAEFPNADCRNRGLTQFRVRGLVKAKAQALWHVLAFNLLRMLDLRCPLRNQSYLEVVMGAQA